MNKVSKIAAGAVLGLGAALGTSMVASTPASAAIVCNGEGFCWHVHHAYTYQPEWGVVVHPNSWHWAAGDHYVWREHRGRGYWRNGVWVTF